LIFIHLIGLGTMLLIALLISLFRLPAALPRLAARFVLSRRRHCLTPLNSNLQTLNQTAGLRHVCV
jgi:hypothetical protein